MVTIVRRTVIVVSQGNGVTLIVKYLWNLTFIYNSYMLIEIRRKHHSGDTRNQKKNPEYSLSEKILLPCVSTIFAATSCIS